MTRHAPPRPGWPQDRPSRRIPLAPPPAERKPEVRVEEHDGALYLVGHGWNRMLCRTCSGFACTSHLGHAAPCVHCGATGFEPSNPHSSGWGWPK